MDTRPETQLAGIIRASASSRTNVVGILTLIATAAITAPIAWAIMFSRYAFYEDEGYLVLTLRLWAHHGGLFTRVFTRYGPAYMFFFGIPERLFGADFTFTSGRIVTLCIWIATSIVLGLTVLMVSRNVPMGVLTQVVSFFLLQSFTNEPMHPGGLIELSFALAIFVVAIVRPRWPGLGGAVLGVLVSVIFMTQFNLGVYVLVAVAYVYATSTKLGKWKIVRPLSEVAFIALGPAVILVAHPHTSNSAFIDRWAVNFAIVYLASALIVVILCRIVTEENDSMIRPREIVRFAIWFAAACVFFAAFAVATGSKPSDMVDGVLFAPLSQSRSFILPAVVTSKVVLWLIAPLALILGFRWLRRNLGSDREKEGSTVALVEALLRILAGGIGIIATAGAWTGALAFVPLVAVCLVPPVRDSAEMVIARRMIAALAVVGSLHAIPVAGSQESWSLMLVVPGVVLAFGDGWEGLAVWWRRRHPSKTRYRGVPAAALLLALILLPWPLPNEQLRGDGNLYGRYLSIARYEVDTYRSGTPLGLPGTDGIRLPAEQVRQLRGIVPALRANCSQFVSVPGYDGLYLLSGIAPPNGMNATVWMYLLTDSEQRSVVRVLRRTRGPVCLVERSGRALGVVFGVPVLVGKWVDWRLWFWAQPIPTGPLVRYLSHHFVPRIAVGPYLILTREN